MTTPNEETPKKRGRGKKGQVAETAPPSEPTAEVAEDAPAEDARDATTEEGAAADDASKLDGDTNGAAPKTVTWNDVARASAEVEANRVVRETVEDVIEVKLDDADLADIARANAADDQEKSERKDKVDSLKEKLKDEKTAIDALDARMRDRNNAVRKGTQARKDKWIVESIFATNTVRYLDPRTERCVYERSMKLEERQPTLPLVSDEAAEKAEQLSLAATQEGETQEEEEGAEVTDPEAVLGAAAEASPSDVTLENEPSDDEDEFDEDDDLGDDEEDEDDVG